jgi:hypothetical protein
VATCLRLYLNYPPETITRPVIYELGQRFAVEFNIRSAGVSGDMGLVGLELSGDDDVLNEAVEWLRELGIRVDPIELDVVQ